MDVSDKEAFSVYPGKTNNPGDIIKGRTFRRLNVTRKIIIKDVPDLIRTYSFATLRPFTIWSTARWWVLQEQIILETEPDQEFLGFMLETKPLELIYQGPTNVSQVLSPFSASPPKVLLSGFRSRCHIVVKGAFPEFRVRQGLDQLIHLYTLAGFPNEELHNISTQILIQHQNLQTHEQKIAHWFLPAASRLCYFRILFCYF